MHTNVHGDTTTKTEHPGSLRTDATLLESVEHLALVVAHVCQNDPQLEEPTVVRVARVVLQLARAATKHTEQSVVQGGRVRVGSLNPRDVRRPSSERILALLGDAALVMAMQGCVFGAGEAGANRGSTAIAAPCNDVLFVAMQSTETHRER